jgi:hypothetical protein
MDLQILVSKKGTKVVAASNLYMALELPQSQYGKHVKRWVTDTYEFHDGIRKPERLKDFARRVVEGSPVPDYYLSLELAKLASLRSTSKRKLKYAKQLYALDDRTESDGRLTPEQVTAMLELTKVMGLVSCQTASEQRHLKTYEERNEGKANQWWNFRSRLLGYSTDKLQDRLRQIGKSSRGRNQREMLMQVDKYEMIRTGVIDLFMSMGKPATYAKKLGDLAKVFARELNVEIFDDRTDTPSSWLPKVNTQLAGEVKNAGHGDYLSLWQ